MCMRFGCNPQIIFCYFFSLNLVNILDIDTVYLVNAISPTVLAGYFCRCFVQV